MADAHVDYDLLADRYDARAGRYTYDGMRDAIARFLGDAPLAAVLDVGCGTGQWLPELTAHAALTAGVDVSAAMLTRAHAAHPDVRLVRARADQLPWRGAAFDRVIAVKLLHHLPDRRALFVEARRVLKPGGGFLTIGLDPHSSRDTWWVYDYFPEAHTFDQERFAPPRLLRGELTTSGFAWTESFEADHEDLLLPFESVSSNGTVDRTFTSQLMLIDDAAFSRGAERLQQAARDAAAGGRALSLAEDLRYYATIGWV
jgi:SAM-dependent methyltransferase